MRQLLSFKDKKIIKVITGIRRCGKSTLLALFQKHLLSSGVGANRLVTINLEDLQYSSLCDYAALYDYVKSRLVGGEMTYVFIDEVQNCKEFQRAIDSLFIQNDVDIYITGSNAYMLSSELATLLTGRYITVDMLPLSFSEYCEGRYSIQRQIHERSQTPIQALSSEQLFRDYVRFGSFPQILQFDDEMQISAFLDALYTTVFKKDLVARNKIRDILVLEDIARFVFDNVGNITAPKRISDTLTTNGRKTSQPTVEAYLACLKDSYLVYKVDRFDLKGKQLLKTLAKFYSVDTGLRNYMLGFKEADRGRMLENVIFLELLRRGYKVNIGKLDNLEVDFVASKGDDITYVQVAETVKSSETLQRELTPLQSIRDFHRRVLITSDYDTNSNYDGIKHLNAIDYLLHKVDF